MEYPTAVEAKRDGELVVVSKYEQEPWKILCALEKRKGPGRDHLVASEHVCD
jgi:hypothetical protein